MQLVVRAVRCPSWVLLSKSRSLYVLCGTDSPPTRLSSLNSHSHELLVLCIWPSGGHGRRLSGPHSHGGARIDRAYEVACAVQGGRGNVLCIRSFTRLHPTECTIQPSCVPRFIPRRCLFRRALSSAHGYLCTTQVKLLQQALKTTSPL